MATRWAVASGLWSATSTWDGLTNLPTSGDLVHADGFTVTIDQNVSLGAGTLNTTLRSGGTVGGQFILNNGVTVAATTFGVGASGLNVAGFLLSGTASATMTGNLLGAPTATSFTTGGVSNSGSGTLTITGNVGFAEATGGGYLLTCSGSGNLTIVGNIAYSASTTQTNMRAVGFSSTGSLSITGNISAGIGSLTHALVLANVAPTAVTIVGNVTGTTSAIAVVVPQVAQPKTFTVTGTVTGSTGNAFLLTDVSMTIIGAIVAGSTGAAVQAIGGQGTLTVTGPLVTSSTNRRWPLYVRRVSWRPTVGGYIEFRNTTGANGDAVQFVSADLLAGNVAASHVRKGTTYGPLTGTCAVPTAAQVQAGVAVDATTGTALLTPADLAAAVWDYLRASAVTADSMGQRLVDTATVDSTGAQLADL